MKDFLALYFFYSRTERNGVFVLTAFSLAILMLPKLYTAFPKEIEVIDFKAFEQATSVFNPSKTEDVIARNEATEGVLLEKGTSNHTLFGFNPNTVSHEELTELGLSSRIATTLIHYRERGGKFRRPEDLSKVYGITTTDYNRLKNYIELDKESPDWDKNRDKTDFRKEASFGNTPEIAVILKPFDPNTATETDLLGLGLEERTVKNMLKYRENGGVFRTKEDLKKVYTLSDIDFIRIRDFFQRTENQNVAKVSSVTGQKITTVNNIEKEQYTTIDINKATTNDWLQLRGIGLTFATRIITHRDKIGGFATIEQLKEVYGLPDSTLQNIAPYLKLTTSVYRKLYVNKAAPDALSHPYLTRKQSESLVRYRLNHGEFKNMNDIKTDRRV